MRPNLIIKFPAIEYVKPGKYVIPINIRHKLLIKVCFIEDGSSQAVPLTVEQVVLNYRRLETKNSCINKIIQYQFPRMLHDLVDISKISAELLLFTLLLHVCSPLDIDVPKLFPFFESLYRPYHAPFRCSRAPL